MYSLLTVCRQLLCPAQFTTDAVHRNYVMSSLDASIDDYNDAVALLRAPTSRDLWESLSANAAREVAEEAKLLAEVWGAVTQAVRCGRCVVSRIPCCAAWV